MQRFWRFGGIDMEILWNRLDQALLGKAWKACYT
jgi:hypothetical protein